MRGSKYATAEERHQALLDAQHRYSRSEKGKAKYAAYRQTDGYREAQRRYVESGRRTEIAIAHRARIEQERPLMPQAWRAVLTARRSGQLVKPAACQGCGRTLHIVAHHHLGYEPEHWLDVQWLCRPCHKAAHREAIAA